MALLDTVKAACGLTSSAFDAEVQLEIDAAKAKLSMAGAEVVDEEDSYTANAIIAFCRQQHNYQGDADRWGAAFAAMADTMALAGEYKEA